MKTLAKKVSALAFIAGICSLPLSAIAADFVTQQHGVTVEIPEILSISADASTITLSYPSAYVAESAESSAQTVTYTVQSNNMRQADAATAINMNLDVLYDRLDFLADVGAYSKISGNTELAEVAAGFKSIAASNTAVAKKTNTATGSDGKLLRGTIPVTYKVKATADVPSGNQSRQLFVTLTTI